MSFPQILLFVLSMLVLEPDLNLLLGHTNHQCQLHAFLQAWVHVLIEMSLEENLLSLRVYGAFFPLLPWSFRVNLLVTIFV